MSKELEALGKIKETIIPSTRSNWETEYYYVGNIESTRKYFHIIEQALKRNEPVKLLKEEGEEEYQYDEWWTTMGICPLCNRQNPCSANYCMECGQALDWSSSNE